MTRRRCSDTVHTVVAALLLVMLALLMAAVGPAEEADSEEPVVGSLGIKGLSFKGSYWRGGEASVGSYSFEAEPRILSVDPDGPTRGKLRAGDVIVAIDGQLITTSEGSRRFSDPPVGEEVRLTIRRHGREREVIVVPVAVPVEDSIAALGAPAPPGLPAPVVPPAVAVAPPPPAPASPPSPPGLDGLAPTGWQGLGLSCARCSIELGPGDGQLEWRFDGPPPEVYSVDPGSPAYRAGLRRGDVLTHIDGLRLNTAEGSQRFSSLKPGQEVVWTATRGGTTREVRVRAGERPGELPRPAPRSTAAAPRPAESHLRWAGSLGATRIEVRGLEQVMVTVSESDDEIVITTSDSTIRLWQEE